MLQRAISDMLKDIEGWEAIKDDILIWGKDRQQHDKRLGYVLDRMKKFNLKLNPEKFEFRSDKVTYMYVGHKLSKAGVRPDPEKIRAVQEMKPPGNVKALMIFLGFVQCLGKLIPNLSELSTHRDSYSAKT